MRQRISRGVLAGLLVQVFLIVTGAPGAGAQDPAAEARLALLALPVSHAPGDALGARLRVKNTGSAPIDRFTISVGASAIIRNRTDLHESFETPPVASALTVPFDRRIAPGAAAAVRVDVPVADLSVGLEDGVHALQFSLLTEQSTFPVDSLTTQLIAYSSPAENPLELVPVVPLDAAPAQAPDGSYPSEEGAPNPLEAAIGDRGWLSGLIGALDGATTETAGPRREPEPVERGGSGRGRDRQSPPPPPAPLRVSFAPTPRTLEELVGMADGYDRFVDGERERVGEDAPEAQAAARLVADLRSIVRRAPVQPVLVPYSFPDLPVLERSLSGVDLGEQLLEGGTVLGDTLGIQVDRRWVLPPAGRLDVPSLQALQAAGVSDGVFLSAESVRGIDPAEAGCPEPTLSFVCPVRIETGVGGPIEGYAHDAPLQERLTELTSPGAGPLEIQRVLAETAMVHAELPGISGRVLHLNIPAGWHPRPGIAARFFGALRTAPWLSSRTAAEGLDTAAEFARRDLVEEAPPFPEAPGEEYFATIVEAEGRVTSFSNFIAARDQRQALRRLRRNVLVAEGQTLWSAPDGTTLAAAYAEEALTEAENEMAKVTLGVPNETTFTSRTGTLDVSVFNQTGYPVDVEVLLTSLDMEFAPNTFARTFPPGTTRLSVGAEAQTSGTFPIEVRVQTDDGHRLATESIRIRSTEFNLVALAITFGAVAFLVLFYVGKGIRRRRRPAAEAPSN